MAPPPRHPSSSLPPPRPHQGTSLFGPSFHPRGTSLDLTSTSPFYSTSPSPTTPGDATSVISSSVLESLKLGLDLPPTSPPTPADSLNSKKMDGGLPCMWQEWEMAEEVRSREPLNRGQLKGRSREPRGVHQPLQQFRRNSESHAVEAHAASLDSATWPSPESEPALLRSQTTPAAECNAAMYADEGFPPDSPSHLQSLCLNFSDVEAECLDRELDRDTLEGVEILPLHTNADNELGPEEPVFLALYFASAPQAAILPGNAATKCLLPKHIRDRTSTCAARGPVPESAPGLLVAQEGGGKASPAQTKRGLASPGSLRAPPACSAAARCIATFSEWRILE